ncbi:hypothetical protein PI124_g17657 [Phytophthora idaei]|nr:hypothetical protein PI125_g18200 [Phytophthora idaei]KAG3139257.1 hypothetical protein PI126_g16530 [Phytophthora idaei]KAG3237350.1 hypothetical protein PI124_g17657 [Phytophthora idaei]
MTKLMSNNQPTTNKRFKQLITGQVGSNVLKNKQFDDWASSVTKAYKKNQEAADTAIPTTLTAHYGEKPLVSMLAAAGGTKSTVTRLENAQLNKWKEEGEKADDIYRLLQINEEGRNLLKSPKLQMWMNYMSKLDKDPYDFLLFKVKANYDDAGLAKCLFWPRTTLERKRLPRNWRRCSFEKWIKNDKTMIDAFQLLKLNEEGTTLLKSPVLTTWVSYVEMLKKDPYELLFLAIKKTGFDEVTLAKKIGAAKQDIHTGSIAAKMEDLQFQKWSKDGKSSEDLFKFLGLNKEGDELFDSPAWSIWASYLNRQELNPELAIFSILRTRFGDEGLTKMVARAKEVEGRRKVAIGNLASEWTNLR